MLKKKKKLQPEGRSEILSAIIVTYNPWLGFFWGGGGRGKGLIFISFSVAPTQ